MHGLWLLCLFSCLSRWLRSPLLSRDLQLGTDHLVHPEWGHRRQEQSLAAECTGPRSDSAAGAEEAIELLLCQVGWITPIPMPSMGMRLCTWTGGVVAGTTATATSLAAVGRSTS